MKSQMMKTLLDRLIDLANSGASCDEIIEDYMHITKDIDKPHDADASKAAKTRWRKHRSAILAGQRKFNNSAGGKTFHRKLGRYLSRKS
jgi:hypothetical protein